MFEPTRTWTRAADQQPPRPRRGAHSRRRHAQDMETLRAELDWDAELTEVLKVLSTSEAAE